MEEKREQFLNGQKAIFERAPELKEVAHKIIAGVNKDPERQSMIVKCDGRLELDNLLFGKVIARSGQYVANLRDLKAHLGDDFQLWLVTLAESSGYVETGKDERFMEFMTSLQMKLPLVDWKKHETLLKAEFTQNPQDLKDLLIDAWHAAEYLARNKEKNYTTAEIGAILFGDSKYLKNKVLASWINRLFQQLEPLEETRPVFSENPTASTVTVCGPFVYEIGGRKMTWIKDLWMLGQSVVLNSDNLAKMENLTVDLPVLSIENESTFNRMKESNREYALVYTAGYPTKAVCRFIGLVPRGNELRHWGDSDPEGYEIAAAIHKLHPLRLFRCSVVDLDRCKAKCRELSPAKQKKAERLSKDPEFPFKAEIAWMLKNNRWLEQENFPL